MDVVIPTKLAVELVPQTCWFSNVRSQVTPADWDRLRRQTYRAAAYKCEICGGKGRQWPVECHEIWQYDDKRRIQKLERLIALCPLCHKAKHLGFAESVGALDETLRHLAWVNGWSLEDTRLYAEHVFEVWTRRSRFDWRLDLTWLDAQHVTYTQR